MSMTLEELQTKLANLKNRAEALGMKFQPSVTISPNSYTFSGKLYTGSSSWDTSFEQNCDDSYLKSHHDLVLALRKAANWITKYATPEARIRKSLIEELKRLQEKYGNETDPLAAELYQQLAATLAAEAERLSKNALEYEETPQS